jgi:hypothetical protein
MRRFAIFWSVLIIFGAAMATYMISLQVGERYERVKALKKQMRADTDAIRMLETELTYRASPQRLQTLVTAHGLQLALPKADQYLVTSADLAPQPGDVFLPTLPQPAAPLPQFAEATPYIVPVKQTKQKEMVQLASLEMRKRIVVFSEPAAPVPALTGAAVLQSPRAAKAADAVEPENKKTTASAAARESEQKPQQKMQEPKKQPAKKAPATASAMAAVQQKPEGSKPAAAPHSKPAVAAKDDIKPAESGGLSAALIASIRTEAAKEAQIQ